MNPNEKFSFLTLVATPLKAAAKFRQSSLWLGFLASLCGAGDALGATTNHLTLEAFRKLRLPEVTLESLKSVTGDSGNRRGYLEVHGVIGTAIQFELLLPEDWNGRFVMGGGGGFVGTVQNMARGMVSRGYATVGTDTGHHSDTGYLADWAFNNLEAQVNFGHLAVHRTAEVAKALIRDYYGVDSRYSYFVGCSRGGGQAMMEAQRYPGDFDGIVAGAPAFNWTGLAAMSVGIAQALYPDPARLEHPVITKESLDRLQASILEQCDAVDGLKDGVVQNPPTARFDLAKVTGISEEQRKAFAAIYHGTFNGRAQIYPGYSPGAECDPGQWIAWITGSVPPMLAKDKVPDLMFAFGTQIWKYLIFNNSDWDYSHYDFANFDRDTHLAASYLNATNPNLDSFKARQGKLIIWHGWADPALPAQATVDYYRQVEAHDPNAGDYCRLFMVPGCLHCGGGPGASEVDWLDTIAGWVEHSQAPDKLIAAKTEGNGVRVTRPIFPFPRYAAYQGTGNTNSAESFIAK